MSDTLVPTQAELKACPFCGGKPRLEVGKAAFEDVEITCDGCSTCGPNYDDGFGREDNARLAITAWNTRTTPNLATAVEDAAERLSKRAAMYAATRPGQADLRTILSALRTRPPTLPDEGGQ